MSTFTHDHLDEKGVQDCGLQGEGRGAAYLDERAANSGSDAAG